MGQIIEIQNLGIALPATDEPFKRSESKKEQYWEKQEYPKELSRIKVGLIGMNILMNFKEKWYDYIDNEV